ncbi:hypothetical protein GCM10023405_14520 [Streptomonospora salina]
MRPPHPRPHPRAPRGSGASPSRGWRCPAPRPRARPVGTERHIREHESGDAMDHDEFDIEVEELGEVTSRDTTAGGDNDGTDSSSDFI